MHPKFETARLRTHDLQIMTVHSMPLRLTDARNILFKSNPWVGFELLISELQGRRSNHLAWECGKRLVPPVTIGSGI